MYHNLTRERSNFVKDMKRYKKGSSIKYRRHRTEEKSYK